MCGRKLLFTCITRELTNFVIRNEATISTKVVEHLQCFKGEGMVIRGIKSNTIVKDNQSFINLTLNQDKVLDCFAIVERIILIVFKLPPQIVLGAS